MLKTLGLSLRKPKMQRIEITALKRSPEIAGYLAWAYMEAAQFALRFQPEAQRFDQRKLAKSRNNTILARKAVAHKLARACYDMRRDLVPFEATQALG
jgi:hypothetical protein